jgi:transposase
MQSMTAPTAPVTVGVDTHLDLHVAAVLDHTGRLLDTQGFPQRRSASRRSDSP